MSVSIQNAPSCKFSDWPDSFSSLNGVLSLFLAVFRVKCSFFQRYHPTVWPEISESIEMYFPVNFQIGPYIFQSASALKSLFLAVFRD